MDTIFEEDWSDYDTEYKYHLESRDKEGKPGSTNAYNYIIFHT